MIKGFVYLLALFCAAIAVCIGFTAANLLFKFTAQFKRAEKLKEQQV